MEIEARQEAGTGEPLPAPKKVVLGILPQAPEKVVAVIFGMFRSVGKTLSRIDGSCSGTGHVDGRRRLSMGMYEYVVDDCSLLQVPIRPPAKKTTTWRPPLPLTPATKWPWRRQEKGVLPCLQDLAMGWKEGEGRR